LACAPVGDVGIFLAAAAEPGRFTDEDMRLLAILLDHTAVAIARLRLQQELIEQARHDALTGVFNRHYFNERIAQEVLRASRYRHPIGLLMIDVDRFKEINDRYGHQTGDMVLREIAVVLKETVRRSDMIVRYGGDEFLVVLTETGHDAEEVARRVRRAVTASAELRKISGFGVTVSVGSIFWHPDKGIPIEEALAAADSRMYAEKRNR
jgi:diguanylate cyclase (GGDEF)-like protein